MYLTYIHCAQTYNKTTNNGINSSVFVQCIFMIHGSSDQTQGATQPFIPVPSASKVRNNRPLTLRQRPNLHIDHLHIDHFHILKHTPVMQKFACTGPNFIELLSTEVSLLSITKFFLDKNRITNQISTQQDEQTTADYQ